MKTIDDWSLEFMEWLPMGDTYRRLVGNDKAIKRQRLHRLALWFIEDNPSCRFKASTLVRYFMTGDAGLK